MKEIYNLLKARNGLDKISLGEMCDFMLQPWIRLHKLFSHGCPYDPNTKSAFAQNQQPQQNKRWPRPRQGTGAEQAQSPPLPLCLGTAPVATGRGPQQPVGGDLVQKKQEYYLLITNWEEKNSYLPKPKLYLYYLKHGI